MEKMDSFHMNDQPQDTDALHSSTEATKDNYLRSSPIQKKKKVQVISPQSLRGVSTSQEETNKFKNDSKREYNVGKVGKKNTRRKRKHVIQIEDNFFCTNQADGQSLRLPQHLEIPTDQYEVTLVRRAIYKKSNSLASSFKQDEMVDIKDMGDTSLGMKLTILSGKVIVQALVPLYDGRASPAQLTGMIQKGDVLLSINGMKLVGLGRHLELLIQRLKPLSDPFDGYFPKQITIRFAVGQGLKLLQDAQNRVLSSDSVYFSENRQQNRTGQNDSFNYTKYAMVDNLTGLPFFHDHNPQVYCTPIRDHVEDEINQLNSADSRPADDSQVNSIIRYTPLLYEFIATQLSSAYEVKISKQRNGYFNLGDFVSSLLRTPTKLNEDKNDFLMIERNTRRSCTSDAPVMLNGAKVFFRRAELGQEGYKYIDPLELLRSECRTFSSRSRFSAKYAKLIAKHDDSSQSSNEYEEYSISSNVALGSEENITDGERVVCDINADDMLIDLAAWNKKWKESMVIALRAASLKAREVSESREASRINRGEIQNHQLQNLLFGDEVAQLMSSKSTLALPPDEITEVLFHLSTQVRTTLPISITLNRTSDIRLKTISQESTKAETLLSSNDKAVLEATIFLIEALLPTWLDTFKPIKPAKRRVVWPLALDSPDVRNLSDELSNDSSMSNDSNDSKRVHNLEEKIADIELDPDTKNDTCELVTFYFTRKLLHDIWSNQNSVSTRNETVDNLEDKAVSFIEVYGSYLKLSDALIAASDTKSKKVINALLILSNFDPTHLHGLRLLAKCNLEHQIYERNLLSCLVSRIESMRVDENLFESFLPLVAKAYPDFKPWQIRYHLSIFSGNPNCKIDRDNVSSLHGAENKAYYKYLCLLMETHYIARMDAELVQEWCLLSTCNSKLDDIQIESRIPNFRKVADPIIEISDDDASIPDERPCFVRDLSFLLDTALSIGEVEIAVKLKEEIIIDHKSSRSLLISTLRHLRNLAVSIVTSQAMDSFDHDVVMKQMLSLLEKLSLHPQNQLNQNFLDLSLELKDLLAHASSKTAAKKLLDTMAESVSPDSLFDALILLISSDKGDYDSDDDSFLDFLRKCLSNINHIEAMSYNTFYNISHSLNRVENMRRMKQLVSIDNVEDSISPGSFVPQSGIGDSVQQSTIWMAVKGGDASLIDK